MLPRICWSCSEVVGNSKSICWHSSCNCFTAFRSMLGIGGTSPSDQVGSVLAAAITAPSTKLSPLLDNRPATKFYGIQWIKLLGLNYKKMWYIWTAFMKRRFVDPYCYDNILQVGQIYWRLTRRSPNESVHFQRTGWHPKDSAKSKSNKTWNQFKRKSTIEFKCHMRNPSRLDKIF